jgi:hypothetical protein
MKDSVNLRTRIFATLKGVEDFARESGNTKLVEDVAAYLNRLPLMSRKELRETERAIEADRKKGYGA